MRVPQSLSSRLCFLQAAASRRPPLRAVPLRRPALLSGLPLQGAAALPPQCRTLASAVPAALVKQLRDRTGASMGKCREALATEDGDLEQAVEWLRRRGVKSMEKRATDSAEALLGLSVAADGSQGALAELRCETDFVTRSDIFQNFCLALAGALGRMPQPAAGSASLAEGLMAEPVGTATANVADTTPVKDALPEIGSVLGEKLLLGSCWKLQAPVGGVVAGYVHPKFADGRGNTGRMGALVALRAFGGKAPPAEGLRAVAAQLARHVVAAQPRFASVESIPVDVLEKERATMKAAHLEQMAGKKAPDEKVLTKILDGKTQKWYSDAVLSCQELISQQSSGSEGKPLPVAEWLQAEAETLGVERLAVEEFHLVCL